MSGTSECRQWAKHSVCRLTLLFIRNYVRFFPFWSHSPAHTPTGTFCKLLEREGERNRERKRNHFCVMQKKNALGVRMNCLWQTPIFHRLLTHWKVGIWLKIFSVLCDGPLENSEHSIWLCKYIIRSIASKYILNDTCTPVGRCACMCVYVWVSECPSMCRSIWRVCANVETDYDDGCGGEKEEEHSCVFFFSFFFRFSLATAYFDEMAFSMPLLYVPVASRT